MTLLVRQHRPVPDKPVFSPTNTNRLVAKVPLDPADQPPPAKDYHPRAHEIYYKY